MAAATAAGDAVRLKRGSFVLPTGGGGGARRGAAQARASCAPHRRRREQCRKGMGSKAGGLGSIYCRGMQFWREGEEDFARAGRERPPPPRDSELWQADALARCCERRGGIARSFTRLENRESVGTVFFPLFFYILQIQNDIKELLEVL